MIRNELKELLPDGWESMFKHRESWDPEGYSVAAFKLKETDKRETVLAKFDKTGDIMDYFFDDKPDNYEISLEKTIKFFTGIDNCKDFILTKDYKISSKYRHTKRAVKKDNSPIQYTYFKKKRIKTHRLIAYVFVPNPYPDRYDIVNHIDKSGTNYKKENLEWCDTKWNNQRINQKVYDRKILYLRLKDNKTFTSDELRIEYKIQNVQGGIYKAIKKNKEIHGSKWEIIDINLQKYINDYPLRDCWYQHPIYPDIFANACGVLKIDGKLRIGCKVASSGLPDKDIYSSYITKYNGKYYYTHRLLAECYFGRELKDNEVVDHIIPIKDGNINNTIENLRICTSLENMNNIITRYNKSCKTILYDIFGKLVKEYYSRGACANDLNLYRISINQLVAKGAYLILDELMPISSKTDYIFYKWKIDKTGNPICVQGNQYLPRLSEEFNESIDRYSIDKISTKLRKYLNTGIPAPDGYYYQQGTPDEMIYDPENIKLEKKRLEIHWKSRKIDNQE